MLIVWITLVLVVLILVFIVDFVLSNLTMFQTPFDIVFRVPLTQWSHTWEDVDFMYILAGSVLLGALAVALSTWVFDTRRKLKLRGMRKELKRLQKSLEEVKTSLPQEEKNEGMGGDAETPEVSGSSSVTPEEITKSFEDTVESGDFFQESPEEFEAQSTQPPNPVEEDVVVDPEEKQLAQETATEAEVVDSEELSAEETKRRKEEKDSVE